MTITATTLDRTPGRVRALPTGPAFWAAMLAASALGTNLGDFCTDMLQPPRGFALLVLTCTLAVAADRWAGRQTQAAYWLAIVTLRAAATNVADVLTHDAGFGYQPTALLLGVAALVLGCQTRPGLGTGSPLIDGRYWAAMLVAGIFGTVAGDLAAHTAGLLAAAALLTAILALVLALRAWQYPAAMPAYWAAVLAERCAGTPWGDGLASRHGAGLGLPLAMACTGAAFLAALLWRRQRATATA